MMSTVLTIIQFRIVSLPIYGTLSLPDIFYGIRT
jgi:hypothetical protein